jgi:hypothetical protein
MSEDTSPGAGILGFFLGIVLAGGSYFGLAMLFGASAMTAAIVGAVAAVIGAAYSAMAFSKKVYAAGFFSILGYLLDMTWSLLNTLAGFLVWIPAAKISGADFITPDDNSRRSGTFVYNKNPRGGGYDATTIGTVIAGDPTGVSSGGWCSHEETHVWQARFYGPVYMLAYILALLLNMLFRLFTGRFENFSQEAYHRIPFEDWAYWAGSISSKEIEWGWWFLGLLLTLIYVGGLVSIPIGIALGLWPLWLTGILVVVVYSLIRAFTAKGH